jgi:hypothetical protein
MWIAIARYRNATKTKSFLALSRGAIQNSAVNAL